MKCRNVQDDVKTRKFSLAWDQSTRCPEGGVGGIRHRGDVSSRQAFIRNVRTCRPDAKGEGQAVTNGKAQSTDAGRRDGATRSRGEGAVMALDRRGCVVQSDRMVNR